MIEYVLAISLIFVVIALLFDRYFLTQQSEKRENRLLEEISKLTKAIIAKNANDYVMTTSIDKVTQDEKKEIPEPDEVDLDTLPQDKWEEAVGVKHSKK